jgi:hypothetical protein
VTGQQQRPWHESESDWIKVTKNAGFRRSRIDCVERLVSKDGNAVTYNDATERPAIDAAGSTDFFPRVLRYRVYAAGLTREFEADEVIPGALDHFLEPLSDV